MSKITDILVHYPILCSVASNLTTLDLFHLASASKLTAEICQLKHATFENLKRNTVCDGSGAQAKCVWDCYLLDSAYECPLDTILRRLRTLVRAEMDYGTCYRMFRADYWYRLSQGKCLRMDPRPCLKCNIMVCDVSQQSASSTSAGRGTNSGSRLVVRLTVSTWLYPASMSRDVSKHTKQKSIVQDFGVSAGRATIWSNPSQRIGSRNASV